MTFSSAIVAACKTGEGVATKWCDITPYRAIDWPDWRGKEARTTLAHGCIYDCRIVVSSIHRLMATSRGVSSACTRPHSLTTANQYIGRVDAHYTRRSLTRVIIVVCEITAVTLNRLVNKDVNIFFGTSFRSFRGSQNNLQSELFNKVIYFSFSNFLLLLSVHLYLVLMYNCCLFIITVANKRYTSL